jgi:hypothetical protein
MTWPLGVAGARRAACDRERRVEKEDFFETQTAAQAALCSLPCRMVKRRPQAIRLSIMSELAESGPSAASTCHPRSWRGRAFSTIAAKRIRFDC